MLTSIPWSFSESFDHPWELSAALRESRCLEPIAFRIGLQPLMRGWGEGHGTNSLLISCCLVCAEWFWGLVFGRKFPSVSAEHHWKPAGTSLHLPAQGRKRYMAMTPLPWSKGCCYTWVWIFPFFHHVVQAGLELTSRPRCFLNLWSFLSVLSARRSSEIIYIILYLVYYIISCSQTR